MTRETTTGFNQNAHVVKMSGAPEVKYATDYAVITDEPGMCQIKSVGTNSDITKPEVITIRHYDQKKVSSGVKGIYPMTTEDGYKIAINDNFIIRSEWSDGHITDDPVKVAVSFETTTGAPFASGKDILPYLLRPLYALLPASTSASDQEITAGTTEIPMIDRVMRNAVKPAALV